MLTRTIMMLKSSLVCLSLWCSLYPYRLNNYSTLLFSLHKIGQGKILLVVAGCVLLPDLWLYICLLLPIVPKDQKLETFFPWLSLLSERKTGFPWTSLHHMQVSLSSCSIPELQPLPAICFIAASRQSTGLNVGQRGTFLGTLLM